MRMEREDEDGERRGGWRERMRMEREDEDGKKDKDGESMRMERG